MVAIIEPADVAALLVSVAPLPADVPMGEGVRVVEEEERAVERLLERAVERVDEVEVVVWVISLALLMHFWKRHPHASAAARYVITYISSLVEVQRGVVREKNQKSKIKKIKKIKNQKSKIETKRKSWGRRIIPELRESR